MAAGSTAAVNRRAMRDRESVDGASGKKWVEKTEEKSESHRSKARGGVVVRLRWVLRPTGAVAIWVPGKCGVVAWARLLDVD